MVIGVYELDGKRGEGGAMEHKRTISKEEARSFLINYHNLNHAREFHGKDGVMQCFQQIKSIQYDPLNVVGRNPDLVLQARVKGYKPDMLQELLYQEHDLTDGFDKEMCIYPTKEFSKFERIRQGCGEFTKKTLAYRGQLEALQILDQVRAHILEYGKTSSKDLSIGASRESRWGHKKLSSAALDYLYCIGELSVSEKKGVQKYYDFTEQVLREKVIEEDVFQNDSQFARWYIRRRIQSVGLLWNKRGGAWQGHYVSDTKLREQVLEELCQQESLLMFYIEGIDSPFYMCREDIEFFNDTSQEKQVRFIAPLDNVLRDREMVKKLFGFEYRWEVYTPVVKRKYGYYVLPVLYGNQFIARFEPEKTKKDTPFTIKNWWWESDITVTEEMLEQIHHALQNFAEYLSVPCLDSYVDIILPKEENK